MVAQTDANSTTPGKRPLGPFRRAVIRGLGVLLPPLLTIVIFLWVGNTVARYLLTPLEDVARYVLIEYAADIRPISDAPRNTLSDGVVNFDDETYRVTPDNRTLVPLEVYDFVDERLVTAMPPSGAEIYRIYVDQRYLQPEIVVPLFLLVFVLLLYLLGRFLAAGVGRFFWMQFEGVIHRLPLVRNVYSSVKQVTDFLFTESEIQYTRVVAVEYPRKDMWSLAMVTGESMLDIESAANEPVLSVLIPTSPMPFTGFTVTVRKSETVDLNITIDQAFQYIVSCGVVVPPQQITRAVAERNGMPIPGAPATKNARISSPVDSNDE